MGPASLEHGEMVESAWKHDERLNNYKMATHTQVEDEQKVQCDRCVWFVIR